MDSKKRSLSTHSSSKGTQSSFKNKKSSSASKSKRGDGDKNSHLPSTLVSRPKLSSHKEPSRSSSSRSQTVQSFASGLVLSARDKSAAPQSPSVKESSSSRHDSKDHLSSIREKSSTSSSKPSSSKASTSRSSTQPINTVSRYPTQAGSSSSSSSKIESISRYPSLKSRPPPSTKSILTSSRDEEMAKQQSKYASLSPTEKREQDTWAEEKMRRSGGCPQAARWIRIEGGYRCCGRTHLITDALLAEGKGGVMFVPLDDVEPQFGPYYPDPKDRRRFVFGGEGKVERNTPVAIYTDGRIEMGEKGWDRDGVVWREYACSIIGFVGICYGCGRVCTKERWAYDPYGGRNW